MKLLRPSVALWEQEPDKDGIWSHIARCVRVCYQSTPKDNGESDEVFVRRVLFRAKPDFSPANHLAMLEHGTVYLYIPHDAADEYEVCSFYKLNRFSRMICKESDGVMNHYVTTNLRVIIECEREHDLQYLCEPTHFHEQRLTFCFITNLGVSREFNRHRVNSIAEESTRYCNYSKDKFGNEVTFVVPAWYGGFTGKVVSLCSGGIEVLDEESNEYRTKFGAITDAEYDYLSFLQNAEDFYKVLLMKGWIPQQAREVLPLATKTQLVHTAFVSDWKHFVKLRSIGVSGAPHPNAKILGDQVYEILKEKGIQL